jgi:GNAT superfamily N-acetyltransferase
MASTVAWRGEFSKAEANALHAEAFGTRLFDAAEWNWEQLVRDHGLGWVTGRDDADGTLVGFVNVVWDGLTHAWLQDVMIAQTHRHQGLGRRLVEAATDAARATGCEWLHVDFEDELRPFYFGACGFRPTDAGLLRL